MESGQKADRTCVLMVFVKSCFQKMVWEKYFYHKIMFLKPDFYENNAPQTDFVA